MCGFETSVNGEENNDVIMLFIPKYRLELHYSTKVSLVNYSKKFISKKVVYSQKVDKFNQRFFKLETKETEAT